jgi:TonB family protein
MRTLRLVALFASVVLATTALEADEVEYRLTPGIGLVISSEEWERNNAPGDSGEVLVGYVVNYDGTVSEISVVKSDPPGVWDERAIEQVRRSKISHYEPGYREVLIRFRRQQ